MKIAAGLLALTLSLAACAADGEDGNTATEEVGSEVAGSEESGATDGESTDDATTDDAMEDDSAGDDGAAAQSSDDSGNATTEDSTDQDNGTTEDSTGDDSTATDGTADDNTDTSEGNTDGANSGLLITALLAQAGLEPTEEILSCVEDRGIDLNISPTADERAVQEATLVLFTCAPDELAEILAADTETPPGTTEDDVECVIAETFRYLGSLPNDEAIAALEQSEMPQDVRDEVLPIIQDNCGLSEDQANAIFES